jgi:hypothetical protein
MSDVASPASRPGPLTYVRWLAIGRNMVATGEDNWEEVWDARADALARVFGLGHDQVFHAPHHLVGPCALHRFP